MINSNNSNCSSGRSSSTIMMMTTDPSYTPPPSSTYRQHGRVSDSMMPIHVTQHRRHSSTSSMGNIIKNGGEYKANTAPTRPATCTLGTGTDLKVYGYGSVMWAEMQEKHKMKEAEELDKRGLMQLKNGKWREAFDLFDKAVDVASSTTGRRDSNSNNISNAILAYRIHRTDALIKLGEVEVAVRELETVLRMDPRSYTAHHYLAAMFLRLGQLDNARRHVLVSKPELDEGTTMHMQMKLAEVGKHLGACSEARRLGDWRRAMKEADAAAHAGADSSPQLLACKVEAILKLNQLYDTKINLLDMPKYSPLTVSSSQAVFFGMFSEAYYCFVQAQAQMATGRFHEAITEIAKANRINPKNANIEQYFTMLKKMDVIRSSANDHYIAGRYDAALKLYDGCLAIEEHNPVVLCNKAACWIKMGKWEQAVEDCTRALRTNPKYIKGLLRRALANAKLGRWATAVADYEVLKGELPKDKQVAEALRKAKTELRKGEHMKYDVKVIRWNNADSGLYQFKPATT